MADDIRDFVHERFRHIEAKLDKILASTEATAVGLIENRLTSNEGSVVHAGASIVQVHERMDGMQNQLDGIGRRLDRIKRRLELSDAPQS